VSMVLEIKEGATLSYSPAKGYQASRVYRVSALAGASQVAKMVAAINDASLPDAGDVYPGIPFCFMVTRVVIGVPATDTVDIRVDYISWGYNSGPMADQDTILELGSAAQQEELYLDRDDNPVLLTFVDKDSETVTDQPGTWPAYLPQVHIVLTKQESSSPLSKARAYAGKVNSVSWRMDPGSAAKSWLCNSITGVSTDNGNTYQIRYEFTHATSRPGGTWRQRVMARDPKTGHPPKILTSGVSYKTIDVYDTADFNILKLAPGDTI